MTTRLKGNMADIAAIVEQLSRLTVMEAADLVKQLEGKWGVTAAAPVPLRRLLAAGGGGAAAPAAEAKTTFDVILVSAPADKKICRHQSRARSESRSRPGRSQGPGGRRSEAGAGRRTKADAEAAKKKLEEAGAKVEIK